MFVIVEYQPFITSKHYQNHAENIMDFEHPTRKGYTGTRHEKGSKFPSHTWLPYLSPNGEIHYKVT